MPLLVCCDVSALKTLRSTNVHLLVTVRVQAVMSGGNFSLFMLLPLHFPQGVGGVGAGGEGHGGAHQGQQGPAGQH